VAGTTISFLGIQMVGASNIYGTASTETITGSISADSFYGGAGADVINGSDGNDDFYVGGTDALGVNFDGGNDSDDIQLLSDASFNTASTFINFERIVTNGFNINIVSGSTVSFAGMTASGTVNIYGDTGIETITGTENGDNIYAGDGADIINGGGGNDNFYVSGTESLGDVYDGGAGTNYVRLDADSSFNSANSFTNIATMINNGFNMYVTSGSTVDFSSMARSGAGEIYGDVGNETIIGFNNTNVFYGLGGADTMTGGSGNDSFWVSGTESLGDVYNANGGTDYVRLGADSYFDNTTVFNGIYGVVFNGFNMIVTSGSTVDLSGMIRSGTGQIHGEAGNETITGMDNTDIMYGFAGNDVLIGGLGADQLYGGNDNDTLYGGDALDDLYGEAGADTFVFEAATAFAARDRVRDFSLVDNDVIDISDLLTGYTFGVDDLTDFVQIVDSGSHSIMSVDVTGTGTFGAGTEIAFMYNISGITDEVALETSGNLITH